ALSPCPAPAHHAAFADQRDDAVDAQLGELLDDPLRPLAFGGCERHRERGLGGWFELDIAVTTGTRGPVLRLQAPGRPGRPGRPERGGAGSAIPPTSAS